MNRLLTDEEIVAIAKQYDGNPKTVEFWFARSIESTILNKLNSAEPIGYVDYGDRVEWYKKPAPETDLFTHPPAPSAAEGWTAIHLKTGNEYQVIGEAIDSTNTHCNQLMVIYQRDGKTFVREAEEFQEKFKAAAMSGPDSLEQKENDKPDGNA